MTAYTLSSPTIIVDGGHNAFPGAARLDTGRVVVVYRAGSQHVGGTPGVIKEMHSDDLGDSWSTPVTVLAEGTVDLRDPALALLSDGRLCMTLFRYQYGAPLGVNVSYSSNGGATWTTPTPLAFGYTDWSACSGPMVEPSPGTLLAFAYGEDTGDTLQSVRMLTSTDNGATWGGDTLLLDGPSDSTTYQEPFAGKLPGGRIMVDVRSDTDNTRRRLIREANGTWSTPIVVSMGVGGRPAWIRSSQGDIILGDRSPGLGKGLIASQPDEASTLSPWENLVTTTESRGTYQQFVELDDDGVIGVAFAYERTGNSDSVLAWSTYTPDAGPPPNITRRRGASSVAFL